MSRGAARGRATARLAAVCAVLFGLFLMHGAPATAAGGCHGAPSGNAVMPGGLGATAMASGHGARAMTSAGAHEATVHSGPGLRADTAFRAGPEQPMRGAVCVSTPARDHTSLRQAGLSALAVVALLAARVLNGRPVLLGRTGKGGPPGSGRSLLLQVCIARV
ncbi:hypothetical protein [Streptomyces sp. NPDC059398]|uniref:hypothetical protein n=1 Tax=Streptomyces sp. NPDC059398 TaxID=3346820 RepID=UPI0036C79EB7